MVAGLTLLERMVVALHRGGAGWIAIVGDEPLPVFRRLRALGIEPRHLRTAPEPAARAEERPLSADGALLASSEDVRRVIALRGRLIDAAGSPLPLAFPSHPDHGPAPAVIARRPAVIVRGQASRARAERELWRSMGSSSDGYLDRWINRPAGRALSRLLVRTAIGPNAITIAGTLLGLAGAVLIALGSHLQAVLGAAVFQLSAAVDCVDGEVARALFKESRLGRWLDLILDNLVHLAIFAAFTVRAASGPHPGPVIWLGLSTAAGAIISLAVVARGMAVSERRGDARLRSILDRLANRDFSVFVLLCVALDRPSWLLWPGAFVAHAFWMGVLLLQAPRRRRLPLLLAAAGLVLFAWLAWRAGPAEIGASLAGLGWAALLVPLPQMAAYLLDTLGWRAAFRRREGLPSLWKLYWIRLAGESVNNLTPSAYVGGEPLKAWLLHREGVPATAAAASVVAAKTLMTVAQVIFIVIGALCALGSVAGGIGLYLGLGGTVLLAAGGTALLVRAQKRGLFTWLLDTAGRWGIRPRALESRREAIRGLDEELGRFYREEPGAFRASIAWHLLGWILGAGEVWLCARWLGAPVGLREAVAIEALASVVKGATLFVPGSLGFQESGLVLLFRLFGLPAGPAVGFGLLRRGRELLCAALGGAWAWRALACGRTGIDGTVNGMREER